MKKHLNETLTPMTGTAAKTEKKVETVPGFEDLLAKVDKNNAPKLLVAIANKMDATDPVQALQKALAAAKQQSSTQPAQEGIHENASTNLQAFVAYLFEGKKDEDEEEKPKKKVSDDEHDERKHEDASVAALEKQLDKIPASYWKRVNTTDKAVELVIKAVLDRLSFSSPSKHSQLRSKLISSIRKY